jgi:hypothetical protein
MAVRFVENGAVAVRDTDIFCRTTAYAALGP